MRWPRCLCLLLLLLGAPAAWAEAQKPGAVRRLDLSVQRSLEQTLVAVAPQDGAALAAEVARLLRWRGNVARVLRRGDRLTLLYRRAQAGTEPELLALRYQGAQVSLDAYRFRAAGDGIARFYDGQGGRVEPTMRHPPVPHYWQISEVVQGGRGRRRHRGDDFKAPEGSVVVLPFAGRVRRINWARRHNGRCVEVELDAGYLAHFLHLQSLAPEVRPGRRMHAGEVLGTVGNTGRSTGAHLHYELLRQRRPVEPLRVHGQLHTTLAGAELAAFRTAQQELDALLQAAPSALAGGP